MKGNDIFLTMPEDAPRWEGVWNGPSPVYPGTCVEIVTTILPSQGRFYFQPYCLSIGADGDPRMMMILDYDAQQGFSATSQIAVGQRCFVRFPLTGQEVNILTAPQPGTGCANAFTQGERLIAQHATGQFVVESTSSIFAPFQSLEHIDQVPSNTATLLWCIKC
jgi:hypothetical protein